MNDNQKVVLFQLGFVILFIFFTIYSMHYPKHFVEGAPTAYAFAALFFVFLSVIFIILK